MTIEDKGLPKALSPSDTRRAPSNAPSSERIHSNNEHDSARAPVTIIFPQQMIKWWIEDPRRVPDFLQNNNLLSNEMTGLSSIPGVTDGLNPKGIKFIALGQSRDYHVVLRLTIPRNDKQGKLVKYVVVKSDEIHYISDATQKSNIVRMQKGVGGLPDRLVLGFRVKTASGKHVTQKLCHLTLVEKKRVNRSNKNFYRSLENKIAEIITRYQNAPYEPFDKLDPKAPSVSDVYAVHQLIHDDAENMSPDLINMILHANLSEIPKDKVAEIGDLLSEYVVRVNLGLIRSAFLGKRVPKGKPSVKTDHSKNAPYRNWDQRNRGPMGAK